MKTKDAPFIGARSYVATISLEIWAVSEEEARLMIDKLVQEEILPDPLIDNIHADVSK